MLLNYYLFCFLKFIYFMPVLLQNSGVLYIIHKKIHKISAKIYFMQNSGVLYIIHNHSKHG
jgi:hypothetical protein